MKTLKKTLLIFCAVTATSLTSFTAGGQDAAAAQPATWGILAGGVGVTGAFRGRLSSGIVGGAEGQLPLPSRWLAIRADLLYHWIDTYHTGCIGLEAFFCGYVNTWSRMVSGSFSLVARLNDPATRWSPYAVAGVATYLTGNTDELVGLPLGHLGFQGGLGFEVRPRNRALFFEVRYMSIPPGGVVPVTMGIRF
jgi:hypothetical protein